MEIFMSKTRKTITAIVLCLYALLPCAGLYAANELHDDEKTTAPRPPSTPSVTSSAPMRVVPDTSGIVVIVPQSPSTGGTVVPAPSLEPDPERTVIVPHPPGTSPGDPADLTRPAVISTIPATPVVPVLPGTISPAEIPAVPVLPGKTSPVEIPVIPVQPQTPNKTGILSPSPQRETAPQKEALAPQPASPSSVSEPGRQQTPIDFLPMPTPLAPGKTQEKQDKPKLGDPLRIPPDAAKTGDLSFLEGCWRGKWISGAPSVHESRHCFDKNGNGVESPIQGTTYRMHSKVSFDAQGRIIKTTAQGDVTICEEEGNATLCRNKHRKYFLTRE